MSLVIASVHADKGVVHCGRMNLVACADPGWNIRDSVFGDLNRDGIADAAILIDTLDSTSEAIHTDIDRQILVLFGNRKGNFRLQDRFGFPCSGDLGVSGSAGIDGIAKGRLNFGITRGSNCRYDLKLELILTGSDWYIARRFYRHYCGIPRYMPCPGRGQDRDSALAEPFLSGEGCFEVAEEEDDFQRRHHRSLKEIYEWNQEWKEDEPALLQRTITRSLLPDSLPIFNGSLADE